jgi:thioredoxin 1
MQVTANTIYDVDVSEFEQNVLERSRTIPVLVDFWADWCPPCVALTPVLERITTAGDIPLLLAKVEVDEGDNMRLAGRYGLRGFPTVILFVAGEEAGRFNGAKSEQWVRQFLDQNLVPVRS